MWSLSPCLKIRRADVRLSLHRLCPEALCPSQCAKPRAQGAFHLRLQGHSSNSSDIPTRLYQASCHLSRQVTREWTLVPCNSGTCQNHLSHSFPFGEVPPNLTTSPSHHHSLSLRTPLRHGQISFQWNSTLFKSALQHIS